MIEMLLIWLVAPILLVLLCLGMGLAFSLMVAKRINSTIAIAIGFLLMAILGSVTTLNTTVSPYTAIIFIIIGIFGIVASGIWFRQRIEWDGVSGLAGLLTYIGFSLPVVAYGRPSWAGWVKLDDTGSWFAITDRLMNFGQSIPSVVTSTFDRVLAVYLGGNQFNYAGVNNGHFSYPVGSFIPFGMMSKSTALEKAWIFQPYLTVVATLCTMILVLILRSHFSTGILLVAFSVISMMAATIFSYVMWGGIKEITLILSLLLFSYALFKALDGVFAKENYLYTAVGLVGLYSIGGKTSLGFAAPMILFAILVRAKQRNVRLFYAILGIASFSVIALVSMLEAGNNILSKILVPVMPDTGNLPRSLNLTQAMGIWPARDFRLDPINFPITFIIITLAICLTLYGLYSSLKSHLWTMPSLLLALLSVVIYSFRYSGIWLTGKAIAVASPIFVCGALLGAYHLWLYATNSSNALMKVWRIRYLAIVSCLLISAGVLGSDVLTYKNVWLAPYSQMNELKTIGKLYIGQGPALMTEYSVFGSRYFLRGLDAEAVSELRVHAIPLSDGNMVPRGFAADIGLFDPSTINYYKLLVLRRSPVASRPPLNYRLVWSGVHYEVWQRSDAAPRVKTMLNLGNNNSPGAVPSCAAVTTFLASRSKTDKIFAATRDKVYVIDFAQGDLPAAWIPLNSGGAVDRVGAGGFSRLFSVDQTRAYDFTLAGSFPGQLVLLVDGSQVYSGHSFFEGNPALTNTLAHVNLSAGSHVLTVLYSRPWYMPGSNVDARFGPLYVSSQMAGDVIVKQISISRIPQLCTQNLDWIATAN